MRDRGVKTDLILLHAPSVYDFRERPVLHGPVSDVVPSTQVFEMYPIGFLTILDYLQRHGHSVRIVNIALRMLKSRRFDVVKLLKSLRPVAFGLDLHWMVHAQGSLEVAALVKEQHPDIPVIFGGLSASYFHQELITYPQVDYVMRGDSTEKALCALMEVIKGRGDPSQVPNLTWKSESGPRVNELTDVPQAMDDVSFDYQKIIKSCTRHMDVVGHLPFKAWLGYPIMAALSCRGCVYDCKICGGSASAYREICGRARPAYRPPERLARDIIDVSRYIKGPIMVMGDTLQSGGEYTRSLFEAVKAEKIKNHIALEFFYPPDREFLESAAEVFRSFDVQISPESHDEAVRRTFGRPYGNEVFESSLMDALELGCKRFDVFFMIGIPEQTVQSVRDTVAYCGELLEKCEKAGYAGRMHPYISPLAPFLDPGSRAFVDPEKHGYRLFSRTLEEHRRALLSPSWKYVLNYESKWMTRDEMVDVTYEAALELNRLKGAYGLEPVRITSQIGARIARERELIGRIDEIYAITDESERDRRFGELMVKFERTGGSTICRKDEMNWPVSLVKFNLFRILRTILGP